MRIRKKRYLSYQLGMLLMELVQQFEFQADQPSEHSLKEAILFEIADSFLSELTCQMASKSLDEKYPGLLYLRTEEGMLNLFNYIFFFPGIIKRNEESYQVVFTDPKEVLS